MLEKDRMIFQPCNMGLCQLNCHNRIITHIILTSIFHYTSDFWSRNPLVKIHFVASRILAKMVEISDNVNITDQITASSSKFVTSLYAHSSDNSNAKLATNPSKSRPCFSYGFVPFHCLTAACKNEIFYRLNSFNWVIDVLAHFIVLH